VPPLSLFPLVVDARRLPVLRRFRMGVHEREIYLCSSRLGLIKMDHGLPIDTGQWRGVPRSQWTCDMCDPGVVGNERHFVFVVPASAAVRTQDAPFALRSRTLRAIRLAARPSYGWAVYLRLFLGSCSNLESVYGCPIESASSDVNDLFNLAGSVRWCSVPSLRRIRGTDIFTLCASQES
jgi:hypothetical protein